MSLVSPVHPIVGLLGLLSRISLHRCGEPTVKVWAFPHLSVNVCRTANSYQHQEVLEALEIPFISPLHPIVGSLWRFHIYVFIYIYIL